MRGIAKCHLVFIPTASPTHREIIAGVWFNHLEAVDTMCSLLEVEIFRQQSSSWHFRASSKGPHRDGELADDELA